MTSGTNCRLNIFRLKVAVLGRKGDSYAVRRGVDLAGEFYLEQEAAREASKEERVKGYRVKVEYQPVAESEKQVRREAVGQVILQALRRLKDTQ